MLFRPWRLSYLSVLYLTIVMCIITSSRSATPTETSSRRRAVFLLGDSTYILYTASLKIYCSGQIDTSSLLPLELNLCTNSTDPSSCFRKETGYVCDPAKLVTRDGFMTHWGVRDAPYHISMPTHRSAILLYTGRSGMASKARAPTMPREAHHSLHAFVNAHKQVPRVSNLTPAISSTPHSSATYPMTPPISPEHHI